VVTERAGVHTAGWMITAATVLAGALLIRLGLDRRVGDPAEPVIGVEREAASVAPTEPWLSPSRGRARWPGRGSGPARRREVALSDAPRSGVAGRDGRSGRDGV
jgi:hypothetical protein